MTTAQPHCLPAELSIYTVAELHPQWLQWMADTDHDEPLAVDASAVEQADAAGVQLLLSLAAGLHRQGRALQLKAPSPPLLEACETLGLAAWASQVQGQEQRA